MPTTELSDTLTIACDLIRRPSVTPVDGGCQQLFAERLGALGFKVEHLRFGDVDNLWARIGNDAPLLTFAGHTDVVPTGPLAEWRTPPFEPTIEDGLLYGRGAADMKGSLAAMLTAVERRLRRNATLRGSIGFLLTSDEEGPSVNGTVKVVEHLLRRGERIDHCVVGEPSSTRRVGDVVRNGRRGSLNGKLTLKGVQGHVAYPEQVVNPIHLGLSGLAELSRITWDNGSEHFPPTSFQISNVAAGTGATNVVPGAMEVLFNFRFSTALTPNDIQRRVEAIFSPLGTACSIEWTLSGHPFLTAKGPLIDAVRHAVTQRCGYTPTLSTSGGTSDGRFIAPTGAAVIELGPCNETIHKINECVSVDDLDTLSELYESLIDELLA